MNATVAPRHAAVSRVAYLGIRLKSLLAYRFEILIWLIGPMLQMLLLATVWKSVYAGRSTVDGISIGVMTTYVTISTIHMLIAHDDMDDWVYERVNTGSVGVDLLRPLPFMEQALWGSVAQLSIKALAVALVLPVGAVFAGVTAPVGLGAYLVSAVLAWLVNLCLYLLLSAIVFWTLEIHGLNFMYHVIGGFLSGALVPLWFMPGWLSAVLAWLPFQATVFTPTSIYVGQLAGAAAWQAVGVQLAWLVLLGALAAVVWRRAIRKTVVQGG